MPLNRALAAALGDEIVLLVADRGCLLLLDTQAARVWRSCDGSTIETIQSSTDGEPNRVRETLHELAGAGLVLQVGDTWIRGPVEWI